MGSSEISYARDREINLDIRELASLYQGIISHAEYLDTVVVALPVVLMNLTLLKISSSAEVG